MHGLEVSLAARTLMTSSISSMSASSRATSELSVISERESPGGLNWGMFTLWFSSPLAPSSGRSAAKPRGVVCAVSLGICGRRMGGIALHGGGRAGLTGIPLFGAICPGSRPGRRAGGGGLRVGTRCSLSGRLPNRLVAGGVGVPGGARRVGAISGVPGRCLHFAPRDQEPQLRDRTHTVSVTASR